MLKPATSAVEQCTVQFPTVPTSRSLPGYRRREQRRQRGEAVAELAGRCNNDIYLVAVTITMGDTAVSRAGGYEQSRAL